MVTFFYSFEVNLQTGLYDGDNIAFHYNPRFGQYVYLNTFRNGNWEKEETVSEHPWTKLSSFTMFVVIKAEGYEVSFMQTCKQKLQHIPKILVWGSLGLIKY